MKIDQTLGRVYSRLNVEEAVIICHGLPFERASVIEKNYDDLSRYFALKGLPSIIFDFSGTGKSSGDFRLLNWVEDLQLIANEFNRVHVIGFSLGGAIALNINAESTSIISTPCHVNIFNEDSLKRIYTNAKVKLTLRGIGSYEEFKRKFINDFVEIEPIEKIKRVKNVLIMHGTKDDVIPYSCAERLFERAKTPKKLVRVINGDHFLRKNEKVIEKIYNWITTKKNGAKIEEITI